MRKFLTTLSVVAAAAGLFAAPLAASRLTGEEKLAKMIEGRTAGEPRSCIFTAGRDRMTLIDKTALVFKEGSRVWVNRTAHPEDLDANDVLVIRKLSASTLCRTDMITTRDRVSGVFSGALFLGDFVPYEKVS